MHPIQKTFANTFARWNITLPPESVQSRQPGAIHQAGWTIHYLFGVGEQGEYLDYYASHRMTNDRHVRIYADGTVEDLPAYQEFMVVPAGVSAAEKQRIEQAYFAHNRRVADELRRKGFAE